MAKRDLYNNIEVGTNALTYGAHAASIAIAAAPTVDTYGYYGIAFLLAAGTITDGTHTLALYESDTDVTGNYTAVAAGDILGTLVPITTVANLNQKFGYVGARRYLRLIDTLAGQTTGGIYGVTVIFGFPLHKPAINP